MKPNPPARFPNREGGTKTVVRMMRRILLSFALLLGSGSAAWACILCGGDFQQRQTLCQDARQAKFVVYGTLSNPRLNGDQGGTTDVAVDLIVKDDPFLANRKTL